MAALLLVFYPTPSLAGQDKPTFGVPPLAYSPANEPAWLDRILRLLAKRKNLRLEQHMLFRRNGRPTFLALVWTSKTSFGSAYGSVFDLHKVRVVSDNDVRLKFVRTYRDELVSIERLSGHDLAGDGVPFLFINHGSGGSGYFGYGMRVYKLTRNSVDVTPDWAGRTEKVVPLPGDEKVALVVSDDRWANFFSGCGQCGPFFDVVMVWTRKGFAPDCQDHPKHYEETMRRIEEYRAERAQKRQQDPGPFGSVESLTDFLDNEISLAFNLIQMGRIEEGRARYETALTEARNRGALGWGMSEKRLKEWLAAVRRNFFPAAAARGDIGCPLMAFGGSTEHIGYRQRIEHFRFRR